jgi:hypothetical protein
VVNDEYAAFDAMIRRGDAVTYAKEQLLEEIDKCKIATSPIGEERLRTWSLVVLALRSY